MSQAVLSRQCRIASNWCLELPLLVANGFWCMSQWYGRPFPDNGVLVASSYLGCGSHLAPSDSFCLNHELLWYVVDLAWGCGMSRTFSRFLMYCYCTLVMIVPYILWCNTCHLLVCVVVCIFKYPAKHVHNSLDGCLCAGTLLVPISEEEGLFCCLHAYCQNSHCVGLTGCGVAMIRSWRWLMSTYWPSGNRRPVMGTFSSCVLVRIRNCLWCVCSLLTFVLIMALWRVWSLGTRCIWMPNGNSCAWGV